MQRKASRILAGATTIALIVTVAVVGNVQPASAAVTFRYGVNFPSGMAAVNYLYGPDGTWKPMSNIGYQWNYYSTSNCASAGHPANRDALIAYANGIHNMTACDANDHLLLDFNHDGELDVTNAGYAFEEHNGKGAGNQTLASPFSVFWFDDNWLARYMAQAYGRALPDGLSDYSNFLRWKILAGDRTGYTPYGSDDFDRLALDGMYYLSAGQKSTAEAKWNRMRDKSGHFYDTQFGAFRYPHIGENYHIGLFKILTDTLISSGLFNSTKTRELWQHSVSLRAAILANQQSSGGTRYGWTSNVVAGGTLMNTESAAINALALATGVTTSYGAGQPPLSSSPNGYILTASGVLKATPGSSSAGHMTYGPYVSYPAGSYAVDFMLRSPNPTGIMAHLDIYNATSGAILAQRNVAASELAAGNQWTAVSLAVTVPAGNQLEFRTWWYATAGMEVAEIRIR